MGILIFAFVVLFFLNRIGDLLRERSIIQRRLGQPVYDWLLHVTMQSRLYHRFRVGRSWVDYSFVTT